MPFEIGKGNDRCDGPSRTSGRDTPTRQIQEDRAFARTRDGMAGTGAEVLQSPECIGRTRTLEHFGDRKSTRLNSSHSQISYAVFCLKKKKNTEMRISFSRHTGR